MAPIALAFASLRRHRTRTILAVLGVAVAAAMLLDMVMLSTGMRESFRQLILSKGFQLRATPKGTLPFDTDATISEASTILRLLHANPDIGRVSPVLGASIRIPRDTSVITSVALGVDPTQQGDYELQGGRDLQAANTLVVSDDFLRATHTRIGDTVTIARDYDPQGRTLTAPRRMIITGRARFLYTATGQIIVAIPLATLQALEGPVYTDRVSTFMIEARSGVNVEQLRAWIATHVPRVSAVSTQTAMAQIDQRLSYFRQLAFILGAVSLTVGFLLVTTLVTVSVNERLGEISVLRAIGISTAHVVQQIVLESLVISTIGTALGLGLGLVTARYLNAILSDFPGLPKSIDFFLFQPEAAWMALGLLIVAGILAGIYPAWRAATLPIATTLRHEAIA